MTHRIAVIGRKFASNLVGTSAYNLSQIVIIFVLARLGGPASVGNYVLMLAFAAPIFLAVGMNLRVVLVTDVHHSWRLSELLRVRLFLNAAAGLLVMLVGVILSFTAPELLALVGVVMAKSIEGTSQLYYGAFQKAGDIGRISRSLTVRAILGPPAFISGYLTIGELYGATFGLALALLVPQVLLDRRAPIVREERVKHAGRTDRLDGPRLVMLLRRGSLLGLDQGVSSLTVNAPRFGIESVQGRESLGVFAPASYIGQVITLITSSAAVILLPSMAQAFHSGKIRRFLFSLAVLLAMAIGVSLVAFILVASLGELVISATIGSQFYDESLYFAVLASAGFLTILRMLGKALEAAHAFRANLLADIICLLVVGVVSLPLIRHFGIVGAPLASLAGSVASILFATVVLLVLMVDRTKK